MQRTRPHRALANVVALLSCPAFALAFALLLGAAPAVAQQPLGERDPEYRQLIDQAVDEFQRSNWGEAAGLFEQAHRIHPNARTLRGMGIAAFEARRYTRALEHLRAALQWKQDPLSAAHRKQVEQIIARAERYVAEITIDVEPDFAQVTVNGAAVAAIEGTHRTQVDPGAVVVRASAEGYQPATRELHIVSGAREQLTLQLQSQVVALEAPPQTAAEQAATRTQAAPARDDGPQFGAWKWIALGAGGLGLVAGGVSHVLREVNVSDHNQLGCRAGHEAAAIVPRCNGYRSDVDSATLGMIIGYSAGALFTGTAIVLFVLEGGGQPEEASAGLSCGVGPGSASCRVRF